MTHCGLRSGRQQRRNKGRRGRGRSDEPHLVTRTIALAAGTWTASIATAWPRRHALGELQFLGPTIRQGRNGSSLVTVTFLASASRRLSSCQPRARAVPQCRSTAKPACYQPVHYGRTSTDEGLAADLSLRCDVGGRQATHVQLASRFQHSCIRNGSSRTFRTDNANPAGLPTGARHPANSSSSFFQILVIFVLLTAKTRC